MIGCGNPKRSSQKKKTNLGHDDLWHVVSISVPLSSLDLIYKSFWNDRFVLKILSAKQAPLSLLNTS